MQVVLTPRESRALDRRNLRRLKPGMIFDFSEKDDSSCDSRYAVAKRQLTWKHWKIIELTKENRQNILHGVLCTESDLIYSRIRSISIRDENCTEISGITPEQAATNKELEGLIRTYLVCTPGSLGKLARHLNISRAMVLRWSEGRSLPQHVIAQIYIENMKKLFYA